MRVSSSNIHLGSAEADRRVSTRQESLQVRVGSEAAPSAAAAPHAGAGGHVASEGGEDASTCSPRDAIDLAILRKLFGGKLAVAGHAIKRAYAAGQTAAQRTQEAAQQLAAASSGQDVTRQVGWSLRYDLVETSTRYEATTFRADGEVTTGDGRAIEVQTALAMERTQTETSEVHIRAGDAARIDPLVLNLLGGAASFDGSAQFDLDGDGKVEAVAQLAPGSAYLALDKNQNGAIDSGTELFGPSTGSGFGELVALDQDGNGWIDEGDAAFGALKLWSPATGEVSPLAAAGVGAIYCGSTATPFEVKDASGASQGQITETGLFLREDGSAGIVQHVDLAV